MFATYRHSPALMLAFSSVLTLGLSPALLSRPTDLTAPKPAPTKTPAPPKVSAKTTPKTPSSVPQNAAPLPAAPAAKPAKAPKPDPLVAPEEISPVPATGPLNLQHLIDAALFNSMDALQALRKLEVARAERAAATDWKDPQLRASFSRLMDVEVGDSFTESSTSSTHTTGSEIDSRYYQGHSSTDGLAATPTSRYQTERGTFRQVENRTEEKQVTPGATRDKIVTRVYETTTTNTDSQRNRSSNDVTGGGNPRNQRDSDNISRNNQRRLVSETTEYVRHRDNTAAEDQYSVALRFSIPNLWEIKPKIAAAEAEIRAADCATKAVDNEIITKVRGLYEELSYYDALAKNLGALGAKEQEFAEVAKAQAPDKLAKAAGDASKSRMAALEARAKAQTLRNALGRMTGIRDTSRISIPANFRHRVIDVSALSFEYLLQMASVFRMDLQELLAKNDAARAQYRRERAARIPAVGFLQAGVGRNNDRFGRDQNELSVAMGITIPLFSNLFNKAEQIPLAEARGRSREIGRLQLSIEAELGAAVDYLKETQQLLQASEKEYATLEALMKNEGRAGAALAKNMLEGLNEAEVRVLDLNVRRLEMHRIYNSAVQNLERALGTRLEKVLQPQK